MRRFECQELEIPAMGEDPNEVSIMWWLRSERDDCPMCLQSLTLLRWLLHLHNDWLERAEECIDMRDDAPAEPCCLADALPPYFFQYEPGHRIPGFLLVLANFIQVFRRHFSDPSRIFGAVGQGSGTANVIAFDCFMSLMSLMC